MGSTWLQVAASGQSHSLCRVCNDVPANIRARTPLHDEICILENATALDCPCSGRYLDGRRRAAGDLHDRPFPAGRRNFDRRVETAAAEVVVDMRDP